MTNTDSITKTHCYSEIQLMSINYLFAKIREIVSSEGLISQSQ